MWGVVMPKVSCKYFTTVLGVTKKEGEILEIPKGLTVEGFLDFMIDRYGDGFGRHVYAEGSMGGKRFKTPNIFVNKKRIQWVQDFPEGVKTKVNDGDVFWFGLIAGGG
jgi:hypothetical protein